MSSASEPPGPPWEPARVAVSRSTGVTIEWQDGHRSRYALRHLRDHCPCATCAGARPPVASPFPIFKPAPTLAGVEQAGNYALRLVWSDGHSAGLYTWDHLRRICPCPQCLGRRS